MKPRFSVPFRRRRRFDEAHRSNGIAPVQLLYVGEERQALLAIPQDLSGSRAMPADMAKLESGDRQRLHQRFMLMWSLSASLAMSAAAMPCGAIPFAVR